MKTKIRQKVRRGLLTVSLLLLPVTLYYFSPALSLQGAAAGVASGSVLVFAGLFVSALFLGRAFCGWACPLGGLQELTARLRGRPVARRRIRWIKYLVWGPWFLLLVYLILQAGGLRRVEFTYQTWHGISVADLQGLLVLAGPGRPQACRRCGSCSGACPMSIDIQEGLQAGSLETTDCILCGSCAERLPGRGHPLAVRQGEGIMKRLYRGIFPALVLLLLASSGLRADSLLPLPSGCISALMPPTWRATATSS